ncbi:MAG: hypothetical protein H8F28_00450 [Fibrella sp.]|nr:hypothetical protein [Armatimonadota bacterium]
MPYVSAYSVKKPDGKLHVLLLNKHRDSAITGNLALAGFTPQASATLYQFGKTQDTNASLGQTGSAIDVQTLAVSNAATNFSLALPAYSVSLLTMTPGSGGGGTGGANNGTGLRGSYFNNRTLTGAATGTRTDATVGFDWGTGAPGVAGIGVDNFSVRWEGQVEAPVTGSYTFTTNSDDGVRLSVNGSQIINNWTDHGPIDDSGTITLTAGQKYDLKMEFYEAGGGAVAKLDWLYPGQGRQRVPQTRLYPATTTTGGDTAVYNFEATTHGFVTSDQDISGIASSADRASAGANALWVNLNTGTTSGYGTLYKPNPGPNLTGGKTVTSRVWFPVGSNLNAIQLFVHQANGTWKGNHVGTGTLTPNAWNTITVTVPNTGSAVGTLGLQFHYDAGPWSGACYIDSINW